jgi:hypothetical protein
MLLEEWTNTLARLAGRMADPLRPHPCEVANFVGVFRELSWLTRGMAKADWRPQGCGLRLARLPRFRTATGLTVIKNKLHRHDYVGAGPVCTSQKSAVGSIGSTDRGSGLA